jgi:hypothetical protein
MRVATYHFSLQVVTNIRYFSRLSKNRKGDFPGAPDLFFDVSDDFRGILVSFTVIFGTVSYPREPARHCSRGKKRGKHERP